MIIIPLYIVGQWDVKSAISSSPSIFFVSLRKVPGEHLKTGFIDLTFNHYILSSKYEVDVAKAVLIFLPIVFSEARGSAAARGLLKAGYFSFDPRLRSTSPQENWDQLSSSSYEACKLALTAEDDNPSSWGSALYTMPWRLIENIAGTFSGLPS